MTMRQITLLLLTVPLVLGLYGCSGEPDCSEAIAPWQEELQRKDSVINELQLKIKELKDVIQKKHEEVRLNKVSPQTMNRELVAEQNRSRQLQEKLDQLRIDYDKLVVRNSTLKRELDKCTRASGATGQ